MKILTEFKNFAVKGNMVDMGVGIIIGGAFGQIVNSLVKDIVMPPLGLLTGSVDFADKSLVLKEATETAEAISLNYGMFINSLTNFLIISIAIFIVIKQMNKVRDQIEKELKKDQDVEKVKEVTPAQDIILLTEIRDLLKKSSAENL